MIFNDVSDDLLEACRRRAEETSAATRCQFVRASAESLDPIEDGSVDVVTARGVLCYLADRPRAFREIFRVLSPGGRLSALEPIASFHWPVPAYRYLGFDTTPVEHLVTKIYASSGSPSGSPLTNFDERDLFDAAEGAGFREIALNHEAPLMQRPLDTTSWDTLMAMAPNPLAPTSATSGRSSRPAHRAKSVAPVPSSAPRSLAESTARIPSDLRQHS